MCRSQGRGVPLPRSPWEAWGRLSTTLLRKSFGPRASLLVSGTTGFSTLSRASPGQKTAGFSPYSEWVGYDYRELCWGSSLQYTDKRPCTSLLSSWSPTIWAGKQARINTTHIKQTHSLCILSTSGLVRTSQKTSEINQFKWQESFIPAFIDFELCFDCLSFRDQSPLWVWGITVGNKTGNVTLSWISYSSREVTR